jgi:FAD dependent oxidoreductase
MRQSRDVVVVGGGLSGVATALSLKVSSLRRAEEDRCVTLINNGWLGHASASLRNGGTIHSGFSYAVERIGRNNREAATCRSSFELVNSLLPPDCIVSEESCYLVNRSDIGRHHAMLAALGLRYEECPDSELTDVLRPGKRVEIGGILVDELQIDTAETMLRFTQACLDAGVEMIIDEHVEAIVQNRLGGAAGVRLRDGRVVSAGHVVICAGRGTADLLRTLDVPPEHTLRCIHQHASLHVEVAQSRLKRPARGAAVGFPVVTQLRDRHSVALYGVPPRADADESLREIVEAFDSWFLPDTFDLDDPLFVTAVEKVEFHSPHVARSTLPKVLDQQDHGVDGLFCIIPGKLSHALSIALNIPAAACTGNAVPVHDVRDRLSCDVDESARKLIAYE